VLRNFTQRIAILRKEVVAGSASAARVEIAGDVLNEHEAKAKTRTPLRKKKWH
jgi:hypothetical protein